MVRFTFRSQDARLIDKQWRRRITDGLQGRWHPRCPSRLPRIDMLGIPQRIIQRGDNRLPCFLDDGDRLRCLHLLKDAQLASGCQLHACTWMDNLVHLLLTPPVAAAVAEMMQRLGRNYMALFNGRHVRTATLWEGRFKACLVDSEDYVPRCYRYIELDPVSVCMNDDPAAYRWSSCATNLRQRPQPGLQPHPCWLALGADAEQRAAAYRALLDEAIDETTLAEIRVYLQQQRALGHEAFRTMVEAKTRRFASTPQKQGSESTFRQ